MKPVSNHILKIVQAIGIGLVVVMEAGLTPVMADALPMNTADIHPGSQYSLPSSVRAALAYPTSAQRFFESGGEQFEPEIDRLQRGDLNEVVQLTIHPDVSGFQESPPINFP
jgi:hypothetical protein